jgi:hypothetical protein
MSSQDSHQTFNCHAAAAASAPVFSGISRLAPKTRDGIFLQSTQQATLLYCVCIISLLDAEETKPGEKNNSRGAEKQQRIINALAAQCVQGKRETAERDAFTVFRSHTSGSKMLLCCHCSFSLHPQTQQFSCAGWSLGLWISVDQHFSA